MLFQAPAIESDFALGLFWFMSIGATIGLPIVLGGISAARSPWVSFELGVFIGMGIALVGTLANLGFAWVAAKLITHHGDYLQVNILTWVSLVLVLATQTALTVGLCRLIDRGSFRAGE